MANLILREPGATIPVCGIVELLLSGRRKSDRCEFVVEFSSAVDATELVRRMTPFIDDSRILEVVTASGTPDCVCRCQINAVDGLVLRGVLQADLGDSA